MKTTRTKEQIESNLEWLESHLEDEKTSLQLAEQLHEKYDVDYFMSNESALISDALGLYIDDMKERIYQTQRRIDREKKKLEGMIL